VYVCLSVCLSAKNSEWVGQLSTNFQGSSMQQCTTGQARDGAGLKVCI